MLRATGCQGGRAPLLIEEGDGAFAPRGGYEIQGVGGFPPWWLEDPNSQSLIPSGRRRKL